MRIFFCFIVFIFQFKIGFAWGFYAHKLINRVAVFTLPPEMLIFYKPNVDFLSESAVNPDKRRYVLAEEASRHYIDLDRYNKENLKEFVQLSWKSACEHHSSDSLKEHGILPWHIRKIKYDLTEAFRTHNFPLILRLSADIGHYIADAHVPLHTTQNYNGQLTNQHGIHGLWESRLPELYATSYDLFTGKAIYVTNWTTEISNIILHSHEIVSDVLRLEKQESLSIPAEQKYSFAIRNNQSVKVYSTFFCDKYNKSLNGMVEIQMRDAIKTIGNFWYSCWIDAGKPLLTIEKLLIEKEDIKIEHNSKLPLREEETDH